MKILIVDDDQVCRVVLQKLLEKMGLFDHEYAIDGLNAIKMFTKSIESKEMYDIVFLDVYMPNKDGISTIQEIRAIERTMGVPQQNSAKVIMITSSADDKVLANAYEANCDGYVIKPYNYSTIACQIEALGYSLCSD